jgi:hypothetical protein
MTLKIYIDKYNKNNEMKNLLIIFLFFLFVSSTCEQQNPSSFSYTFEQSYSNETIAINDLFTILHNYSQDSIPLKDWPAYVGTTNAGQIVQQMLTKKQNDSLNYVFIYTTYRFIDTTYYNIKVRKEEL